MARAIGGCGGARRGNDQLDAIPEQQQDNRGLTSQQADEPEPERYEHSVSLLMVRIYKLK